MSQQTTLNNYFKSKASPPVPALTNKRHIICLTQSPCSSKIPRNNHQETVMRATTEDLETVTVSSDSDCDFCTPKKIFQSIKSISNEKTAGSSPRPVKITCDVSPSIFNQDSVDSPSCNSQATQPRDRIFVRKDLTEDFNSFATCSPNADTSLTEGTPSTPSKTPRSNKSSGKYFSPTKKRVVMKKSPAKRNLAREFHGNNGRSPPGLGERDDFPNACDSHDFKTKFFLSMIDKYLRDDGLRQLLEDSSQKLLTACMNTPKPGMKLVCRLYWRQPAWFQRTKLLEICTKEYRQKKTIMTPLVDGENMQEIINFLVTSGLIESSAGQDENTMGLGFDAYAKILTRPELLDICKDLKLKIQSKQDAVQALQVFSRRSSITKFFIAKSNVGDNRTRVLKMMREKAGVCYKLSELARATLDRLYMLMYLGADYSLIREKRLELMLINDQINQETYPLDKDMVIDNASVVFQSKEQFDRYYSAHNMYENYLATDDGSKKIEIINDAFNQYKNTGDEEMLRVKELPTWLRKFTPAYVYVKILESGVQELKKDRMEALYNLAVDILRALVAQTLLRQHRRPDWHDELALILSKYLDRCEEAAEVLIEGLQSDLCDEAKDYMRPRAIKLARQQNIRLAGELRAALLARAESEAVSEKDHVAIHIYKHPVDNYNQKGKQRFEARTEDGRSTLSAEEYCIMHLINEGRYTHGEHWEGRIITTMFALLFWDMIYTSPAGAAGVFLSRFQRRPLDMLSDSFRDNRQPQLLQRLAFIQRSGPAQLLDAMRSRWDERPENEISDIQRSVGWENINMVVTCLGAPALAAICRRLVDNFGHAHTGFPDLTMWNVHTNKITFIEVKTDADTPSIKQLQWMEYLSSCGIDTAFCYVGANTTRNRARASDLSLSPD